MNHTLSPKSVVVEEAYTILQQLGGNRFLAMTGAHQLLAAIRSEHNPHPWLRMNLQKNQAHVNRLKVTLMPTDTYTVEFYRQEMVDYLPVITQQQTFERVYGDQLPALFTAVTGYDTHL